MTQLRLAEWVIRRGSPDKALQEFALNRLRTMVRTWNEPNGGLPLPLLILRVKLALARAYVRKGDDAAATQSIGDLRSFSTKQNFPAHIETQAKNEIDSLLSLSRRADA